MASETFEELRRLIRELRDDPDVVAKDIPLRVRVERFMPLIAATLNTLLQGMPQEGIPPLDQPIFRGMVEVTMELMELTFPDNVEFTDEMKEIRAKPKGDLQKEYQEVKDRIERDLQIREGTTSVHHVESLKEAVELAKENTICDHKGCENTPKWIKGYEFKALGAKPWDGPIGAVSVNVCEEHVDMVDDLDAFIPDSVWHEMVLEYRQIGHTPDRHSLKKIIHTI